MFADVRLLQECTGFQWDEWNVDKNWLKHHVTATECEQLFFNRPLVIRDDEKHSRQEERYYALGQTDAGRLLFAVFVIRGASIRIISARDMTKKEKKGYLTP
jgi:uncharacterized protein